MTDNSGDIFREVEEDLRHDKMMALWKKYGPWAISAVVGIVVVTAVIVFYNDYVKGKQEAQSDSFQAALKLLTDGKPEEAIKAFDDLAQSGDAGYRYLTRLHKAAHLASSGDVDGALAIYDEVAADRSVDESLRGLAVIRGAMLVADTEEPAQLQTRLHSQLGDESPWRHYALELAAYAAIRAEDYETASKYLGDLAGDRTAPQGVAQRARAMQTIVRARTGVEEPVGGDHAGHNHD